MILAVDRDEFWELVDRACATVGKTVTAEDAEAVASQVVSRLTALGPTTAVEFQLAFDAINDEAYRWDLWAAAYLMRGGCSDDGFDYFRGWLVAQGRAVWERALDAPDSLSDVGVDPDDDMVECEDVLGAARTAYEGATGEGEAFWEAVDAARGDRREVGFGGPAGEDFDFDDAEQMRARLPRLAAIYLPAP
jgi:hypothetical protein